MTARILTALLLLGSFGLAQNLTNLLPEETVLALGMEDLQSLSERLEPFADEFERLEVADALEQLGDTAGEAADNDTADNMADGMDDLDELLGDLTAYDILGGEAWIALSVTPFNPIPAVTLITRLDGDVADEVAARLEETRAETTEATEALTEGAYTFYQQRVDDPDEPFEVLAYTLSDNLLMLSTNPDTLRGVLRRLGGADEPSFASSEGFESTLGRLEGGNFYSYFNYAELATLLQPLAQGFGFDALVDRLGEAFVTAGSSAGVIRATDTGLITESFQAPNAVGGDDTLFRLLTEASPVPRSALEPVPQGALSASSSTVDLQAWWNYLNEISRSVPELGSDLNTLLLSFVGIDLQNTLFDWTGNLVTTVTTGVGETVEPGMPASNLLGETVYIIEARDEALARDGLQNLFQNISATLAAFSDPSGGMGDAAMEVLEMGGVTVSSYAITDGVNLSYAVNNGFAFIATSDDAMRAVLTDRAGLATDLQALLDEAPENATALGFSDNRAALEGTANQLASQLQLFAGLSGSQNLDFDAVTEAADRLESFLLFVAERLGTSYSYSEHGDEGIRSYSETQVDW